MTQVSIKMNEWMDRIRYTDTVEYFSAIKRNEVLVYATPGNHSES